jgi:hypothetical protein
MGKERKLGLAIECVGVNAHSEIYREFGRCEVCSRVAVFVVRIESPWTSPLTMCEDCTRDIARIWDMSQ